MIHHIVLFTLKPKADPDKADETFAELEELLKGCPSVMQFAVSKVMPHRAEKFQYVQFSAFEDMDGVETWRRMPDHEEMRKKLIAISKFEVVDYEV